MFVVGGGAEVAKPGHLLHVSRAPDSFLGEKYIQPQHAPLMTLSEMLFPCLADISLQGEGRRQKKLLREAKKVGKKFAKRGYHVVYLHWLLQRGGATPMPASGWVEGRH